MKLISILAAVTFASTIVGCTDPNMKLETSYGPKVSYSGLGPSYTWKAQDGGSRNHEFHDLVIETIDNGLQKKGFVRQETGAKDFLLDYTVTRKERMDTTGSVAGEVYPEGTFVFRVIDPQNGQRIWSAVARARIIESTRPEERAKRIKDCLAQILREFPAKKATTSEGK